MKFLIGYSIALGWAALLCAITLFPFIELVQLSNRGGEYPTDPFAFRSVFFAFFGAHQASHWIPSFNGFLYVGVISLPIILNCIGRRDNIYLRMALPLSVLTLVGLIVTTSPLKPYLVQAWHVFATVAFFRLNFFWGIIAAVLVGHGLQRLYEGTHVPHPFAVGLSRLLGHVQWLILGSVPLMALGLTVLYFDDRHAFDRLYPMIEVFLKFTFIVIVSLRVLGLHVLKNALANGGRSASFVSVLLIAELLMTYTCLRPRTERAGTEPYPLTPEVAFLQANSSLNYRIAEVLMRDDEKPDAELTPIGSRNLILDGPVVHGLHTANVYQSLNLREVGRFWEHFGDMDVRTKVYPRATNAIMVSSAPDSPLYDALAVRYLVSRTQLSETPELQLQIKGESFYVYERKNPLPRAYFVNEDSWARHSCLAALARQKCLAHEAQITQDLDSELNVSVFCPTTGYLVLSDANYPGWRAWVDNDEVPILRANGYARAVAVAEGNHRVVFRYEPVSFVWGWRTSLVSGCLTLLILAFIAARRFRRDSTARDHIQTRIPQTRRLLRVDTPKALNLSAQGNALGK